MTESIPTIIKIRCFADFTTSEGIRDEYESKCLNFVAPTLTTHYGTNRKYIFTTEEDYTHVFIFNKAMPDIAHIPKQNVIGFAHEPLPFLQLTPEFIEYAQNYIGCYYLGDKEYLPGPFQEGNDYYLGDKEYLPEPFQEGNGYLSCYLQPLTYSMPLVFSATKKFMSIMISQKYQAPGHKYRHELVQEILKTDLPIDIYGRGCMFYNDIQDPRIKGEFQSEELYKGYTFTICIENFRSNHYFSEKIINPLNRKVTPLYLGCYNIRHYFPEMYVELTGNARDDMLLLQNIYKNPQRYSREIRLDRVDKTINIIRNLSTFF